MRVHILVAIERTLIAATVVALLSTSCSASSSDTSVSQTPPLPLEQILQNQKTVSKEVLKQELKDVYSYKETPEATKQEAAYVLGRLLQNSNIKEDQQLAIELFEKASKYEGLWQRSQWHISEVAANLGLEKVVRRALESLKNSTEDTDTKAGAEYGLAQSYLRANEPQRAKDAFEYVSKQFNQTQFALGATYYLGEMLIDNDATRAQGLSLFRHYLKTSPNGHFSLIIISRLAALKDFKPSVEDHDLFGMVYFANSNWNQALKEWHEANLTTHWYEKDVCLFKLGQKQQALEALKADIRTHADARELPDAAALLCQMQTKQEAIGTWQTVRGLTHKFNDVALWNLAIRASGGEAIAYYKEILEKYPTSTYASEASWWTAWHEAKSGKTAEALTMIQSALSKYPQAKAAPRFAFWIGKFEERLNHKDKAIAQYKKAQNQFASNYYGYRSGQRLAALSGSTDRGWSTQPNRKHPDQEWAWPEPPQLISYGDITKQFGLTISVLSRLRQFQECIDLMPASKPETKTADAKLRAWLLSAVNLPLEAINTASRGLVGKPQASGIWYLSYPLLYAKTIAAEAKTQAIDPLLVHALVREESRYNHMAISHSHALGLMQLLPGTAQGVAKRLGVKISDESDIHRPENNIKLGTDYLANVIRRFDGNALCGVASYNGGPNAVKSILSKFQASGQSDYDVFVEDIPINETRDYVRKVFGSFWNYQAIY